MDEFAVAFGRDNARTPQCLQVLGDVGDGTVELRRQRFYAARALREVLDHLQAQRMAERLGDDRELFVERLLRIAD